MMAVSNGVKEYEGNGGHGKFTSDVQLAILYNGEFDMWDLVEKKSLIDAMNRPSLWRMICKPTSNFSLFQRLPPVWCIAPKNSYGAIV